MRREGPDPQLSPRSWALKYALERGAGAVGLCLASPLMVGICALVKLTSPGPVFHVSQRLGKNGKIFKMIKFRSMRAGAGVVLAPDGKVVTVEYDPRLTPVGRLLRLGFDELPQLLNVARGEMCLVGPRPDVPWELPRYSRREGLRLRVLPGITGLAQVLDSRALNNAQSYELDARYVQGSDAWMDLKVLLATLPYALGWRAVGRRLLGGQLAGIEALGDEVSRARGEAG